MNAPVRSVNDSRQSVNAPDPFIHAHNAEIEKSVLSILLDGRQKDAFGIFAEVCPDLDTFWIRNHKIIALAIHEVAATGQAPDAESVALHLACMPFIEAMEKIKPQEERRASERLPRLTDGQIGDSALAGIGGHNTVIDASAVHAPATSLRRNCEQLARFLRQRRAIAAVAEAGRRLQAADGSNQVESIAGDTSNALSGALGKGKATSSISVGMTEVLARHDDAKRRREAGQAVRLASWGVPALDAACPLAPGRYIVLAALPGGGKTSLLLQAASATRKRHGGAAIRLLSWEISNPDLSAILVARDIGVSRKSLDLGWLTSEQRDDLIASQGSWSADDITTMGQGEQTKLQDIAAWVRLQHRLSDGKLLMIGIDYLQLLPGTKHDQKEYDRVTAVSRMLMALKTELNICIVALSQFSRDSEKNGGGKPRKPRASDLRGSGSLEQDADAVVILYPEGPIADVRTVDALIVKNRSYPTYPDGVRLDFHMRAGQVFSPPTIRTPVADEDLGPGMNVNTGPSRGAKMKAPPQAGEDPYEGA